MKINIEKLHLYGHIGVYEEEKANGQDFDVSVYCNLRDDYSYATDELDNTVNYGTVANLIQDYFNNNKCDLIETVSENIAGMILDSYDVIDEITVEVHKPNAPVNIEFDDIYVSCNKKWEKVYLSLGSNVGDKEKNIKDALHEIKISDGIRNVKVSKLYDTKPYGKIDQDDFVNAVCELETYLTPFELLDVCNAIEEKFGRERVEKWGPRTIDIDIVLIGNKIIGTDRLCVPHIDMHNREFVLKPLVEIAPFAYHPVLHKRAREIYYDLLAENA